MHLSQRLPVTPEIRRMAVIAEIDYNLQRMPSADDVINHHITASRMRGIDFAPWTEDGDRAFRRGRA